MHIKGVDIQLWQELCKSALIVMRSGPDIVAQLLVTWTRLACFSSTCPLWTCLALLVWPKGTAPGSSGLIHLPSLSAPFAPLLDACHLSQPSVFHSSSAGSSKPQPLPIKPKSPPCTKEKTNTSSLVLLCLFDPSSLHGPVSLLPSSPFWCLPAPALCMC